MTFKEIQDAVKLDRFNETQRAAIKDAINSRYGRVWALHPWSFKRTLVSHSLSVDEDEITLAEVGLQAVEGIWSDLPSDFSRMYADRPEFYLDWADANRGVADAFTLVGDTITLGRPVSAATDLLLLGQKKWERLVADADVPLIPEEYHFMLVQGAAADMLLREADPTWQSEEKQYADQIEEMKQSYLANNLMMRTAYPSWPY